MFDKDLVKHSPEILAYLRNHQYETSDAGIVFPKAHAVASGMYAHRVNGGEWSYDPNLLPSEGLTYLLSLLGAGTKLTTWYIAPYAGAVSPGANWTAATFASTATEITSGTEGYTNATRPTWTAGTAAADTINNNASPVTFTIITASTLVMNGVGMLSESAKGAATGKLLSATRFSAARSFATGDLFDVKYAVSLTST
jgi:hypothetical protein